MRYVVFVDSNLRGRIQLFRYGFIIGLNLLTLNYFILKSICRSDLAGGRYLSQLSPTVIIVTISYLSQKHFSFKTKKVNNQLVQVILFSLSLQFFTW